MRADFSKLFVMDEAFTREAIRADFAGPSGDLDKWASGTCTNTIAMKQYTGRKRTDLVGTTYAGFCLLSQRALSALEKARVTGWNACEIVLADANGDLIDGYRAVGITSRCGALDSARSKLVTRLLPKARSSTSFLIGIYFNEESWDGSDLFRPQGTMLTIATLRVKQTLAEIEATNVRFRPLPEFERPAL